MRARKTIPFNTDSLSIHLSDAIDSLRGSPLAESILIEKVTLTGGTQNRVLHRLGRPIRGWIVVRATTPSTVYEDKPLTANDTQEIWLNTSLDGVVSLLVF